MLKTYKLEYNNEDMNFQFYLEKLMDSEDFQNFKRENPDAYLCSGFFSIDKEKEDNQQHLDYYIPELDKMFSFKLLNEGKSGKPCAEDFEYTSANNEQWLSTPELKEILTKIKGDYKIEQSRWSKEGVPV